MNDAHSAITADLSQIKLNALTSGLQAQRDNALNQVVNVQSELAVAEHTSKLLQQSLAQHQEALTNFQQHHAATEVNLHQLQIALSNIKSYLISCNYTEEDITSIVTGDAYAKMQDAPTALNPDAEVEPEPPVE